MGQDELPAEVYPLDANATDDEKKEHAKKTAEREKTVKNVGNRINEVWCNFALVLDNTTLIYLSSDCFNHQTGSEKRLGNYFRSASLHQKG